MYAEEITALADENRVDVLPSRARAPPARQLFSFRLYLPKQWCADRGRRERAQVPEGTVFATKTEQGTQMVTEAVQAGVPFAWLAGDEVYGRSSKLRAACQDAGKGYVLAPRYPGPLQVRERPPRRRPAPAPVPLTSRNTGATPAPSRPVPARNHPATSA